MAAGHGDERTESARTKLREAFHAFRARAAVLADEIPQDLRLLTVHDISHIDALWEIADLVVGEQYEVNPVEAFILGGAFLLHDLGMSLSAYAEGIAELKQHEQWTDVVAALLRQRLGRPPTEKELSSLEHHIEKAAKEQLLRNLHAKRASSLATTPFRHRTSDPTYYLLESTDLRHDLGALIGQVAYSHWWPIEMVADQFDRHIGSPVFCPREWRIDPLKLASIVRVADACHLDARRAPGFLRALRKPSGTAEQHWIFQEHLHKPDIEHDRVVFSSSRPFSREEFGAWWLCYDTLRSADRELRDVDSLLHDTGRVPFAAKGIASCDDPKRLQRHIPTEGWDPVDVRIKVTDVASLVRKLGGRELYGEDPTVPLRELIQNATDAVLARRLVDGKERSWGRIIVELDRDGGKDVISVTDTGVGMSRDVLSGAFMDFGTSYWGSALMVQEHPGLMKKGFESTGQYGIGFYSVFMWGSRVQVITRSRNVGPAETLILEFKDGLTTRPLLRFADRHERLADSGTVVRVWLDNEVEDDEGILSGPALPSRGFGLSSRAPRDLTRLCAWLCPASDVDIFARTHSGELVAAVTAFDWKVISPSELLKRVIGELDSKQDTNELYEDVGVLIRPIVDECGEIVARLGAVIPRDEQDEDLKWRPYYPCGVITAGQFRSQPTRSLAGIAIGRPVTASRNESRPVVSANAIAVWASEQMSLIRNMPLPAESQVELANLLRGLGADTDDVPIALTAGGWRNFKDLAKAQWPDEVILLQDAAWSNLRRKYPQAILLPNVIVTPVSRDESSFLFGCTHSDKAKHSSWKFYCGTTEGAAIEAVAQSWGARLVDVLDKSEFSTDERSVKAPIGTMPDGTSLKQSATIVRRP